MSTNELEVGRVIPATPAGRIEHVQHLITGLYADVLAFRAAIENAMPFIEWSAEAECDCDP